MGTRKEFEPIDEAVADLLGEAVTESGMSYRALRDATGLSINRIGIILRKEPPPATMGEIGALTDATGRDITQLVARADQRTNMSEPRATFDPRKLGLAAQEDYSGDEDEQ